MRSVPQPGVRTRNSALSRLPCAVTGAASVPSRAWRVNHSWQRSPSQRRSNCHVRDTLVPTGSSPWLSSTVPLACHVPSSVVLSGWCASRVSESTSV